MILTSPTKDFDQTPPVTTTFDPGSRSPAPPSPRVRRGGIDWDRVERIHSFVRARSYDRLHEADQSRDFAAMRRERQSVQAIEAMLEQARQRNDVVVACAITFFRARAMRDAHHPEFLGEWLGKPSLESRAG